MANQIYYKTERIHQDHVSRVMAIEAAFRELSAHSLVVTGRDDQAKLEASAYPERAALASLAGLAAPTEKLYRHTASLVDAYQQQLRSNLARRGIQIKIIESYAGVSVIRIVAELQYGEPPSSIDHPASVEQLAADIAEWLKLPAVPLIASRQGRFYIDINRDAPEGVSFEQLMAQARACYPAAGLQGRLIAPIGRGQLRELVAIDLTSADTPHLFIGGTAGSGASELLQTIALSLMCLYAPAEAGFVFLGMREGSFAPHEHIGHARHVAAGRQGAANALARLLQELELRHQAFARAGAATLHEYKAYTGRSLERLVIVIDELASLLEPGQTDSLEARQAIQRIGAAGGRVGLHLLACSENSQAHIAPKDIHNELIARIAFRTADAQESRRLLGEAGAEKLCSTGDFLLKASLPHHVRAQQPSLHPGVQKALLHYFDARR